MCEGGGGVYSYYPSWCPIDLNEALQYAVSPMVKFHVADQTCLFVGLSPDRRFSAYILPLYDSS